MRSRGEDGENDVFQTKVRSRKQIKQLNVTNILAGFNYNTNLNNIGIEN